MSLFHFKNDIVDYDTERKGEEWGYTGIGKDSDNLEFHTLRNVAIQLQVSRARFPRATFKVIFK